ncbi:MAG: iron-containing alcohol dehydrogenase [bacterium]|nr:iron-containing alcohol dehydrogenase [bacterium]
MNNFVFYNPVKVVFGRGSVNQLGSYAAPLGTKCLLVIGQGSVRKNQTLDRCIGMLESAGIKHSLLENIMPNPRIEKAYEGIRLAKKHNCDFVIALGGGSVIDTAKAIAAGFYYDGDTWDFFTMKSEVKKALPLMTVLTVAATGSEMNSISVMQNDSTKQKIRAQGHPMFPTVSILDPELTKTLPKDYTAYASVDIISHVLEGYLTSEDENTPLQDGFTESIVKSVIEETRKLMSDLSDIEARSTIMWASSLALSGFTTAGIGRFKFENHLIEHSLSAYHDIPHGAGLSIVIPAWMKENRTLLKNKFEKFARNVFGKQSAEDAIISLENFFREINSPTSLSFYKISNLRELTDNIMECAPTRNLNLERGYVERILEKAK